MSFKKLTLPLVLTLAVSLVSFVAYTSASTPTPLDGSSIVWDQTGASPSITLTTSRASDIVVVLVSTKDASAYRSVSSVAASGITFARHDMFEQRTTEGYYVDYEEWWAAASSVLLSVRVTVNLSSAPAQDSSILAFAVNGAANMTAPFDASTSLPISSGGSAAGYSVHTSVTTTGTYDFVFAGFAGGSAVGYSVAGSGFTLIQSDFGDSAYFDNAAEYVVVSGAQTNLSAGFTNDENYSWDIIGDAIALAPVTTSTSTVTVTSTTTLTSTSTVTSTQSASTVTSTTTLTSTATVTSTTTSLSTTTVTIAASTCAITITPGGNVTGFCGP
jgi:hypothetical protein